MSANVKTGEKLKLLHALCGKLLTLISTRDFIEDCADEQRAAKMELRELKAEQHRREREEAANRYCQALQHITTSTTLGIKPLCNLFFLVLSEFVKERRKS